MTTSAALPRVVLDTDTFNEVDDQFALTHLLLFSHQAQLEAVYAAPFHNPRSSGPADGMEQSFAEIQRVLEAQWIDRDGIFADFFAKARDRGQRASFGPRHCSNA